MIKKSESDNRPAPVGAMAVLMVLLLLPTTSTAFVPLILGVGAAASAGYSLIKNVVGEDGLIKNAGKALRSATEFDEAGVEKAWKDMKKNIGATARDAFPVGAAAAKLAQTAKNAGSRIKQGWDSAKKGWLPGSTLAVDKDEQSDYADVISGDKRKQLPPSRSYDPPSYDPGALTSPQPGTTYFEEFMAEQERQDQAEQTARLAEQERQLQAEQEAWLAEQERQYQEEQEARLAEQERRQQAEQAARLADDTGAATMKNCFAELSLGTCCQGSFDPANTNAAGWIWNENAGMYVDESECDNRRGELRANLLQQLRNQSATAYQADAEHDEQVSKARADAEEQRQELEESWGQATEQSRALRNRAARLAEQERRHQEEEAARLAEWERQRQVEAAARLAEQHRRSQEEEAARLAEWERRRQGNDRREAGTPIDYGVDSGQTETEWCNSAYCKGFQNFCGCR